MRQFLPIKGPGGRALTVKEKVALVVLAVTLILCVLTLLAGDHAFGPEPAQNPVFAVVSALARSIGVGIIGLYAIVLLWSALIFFKGERVAAGKPMSGRAMAALAIAVGISGILGLSRIDAAGDLGWVVGTAIGDAFGFVFGFAVLLSMLALGGHLAGQGAWTALRGPAAAAATATATPPAGGFTLPQETPRVGGAEYLPDDGDPSADERTRAIAQAMEEIERSQGVTIVDVEPEEAEVEVAEPEAAGEAEVEDEPPRASIGEDVESTPEPEEDSEEGQLRNALGDVHTALAQLHRKLDTDEQEEYEDEPANPGQEEEEAEDDEYDDEEEEAEYEDEEGDDFEEEEEDDEVDEELSEDEYEGEDDEEEWEEEAAVEEDEDELDDEDVDDAPARLAQPYLFPVARREIDEEPEAGDEPEEPAGSAIEQAEHEETENSEDGGAGTRFDWRGRPIG